MSSAKKVGRRRQKKQFMDEQDLQNQQNLQQMNKNNPQTDLFQAAKLQQNYFIRSQNNKNQKQFNKAFNLDDQEEQNNPNNTFQKKMKEKIQINELRQQQNNDIQQENNQETKQKTTDKKKRRKPLKNKKQSIFDQDSQQNEDNKKGQNNQDQQQDNKQQEEQIKKKLQFKNQIKQKSNSQISNRSQQQRKQQTKNTLKNNDAFDNIIKDQQQQQQQSEQQRTVHLHKILNSLNKEQRKRYLYEPLKPREVALGYFKRISSGLSQIYQFLGEDHIPILFCQNQRGCIGCNYYVSLTKQMDKNKPSYLGKLRGNATGSLYNLYDCGIQPKKQMNRSQWRVSLAAIEYQSNFMGFNGPRKLKVTVPSPKHFQDPDNFKLSEEQSILNFKPPVIAQFRNKTPKWNQKLKSYALNFGGRVKLASIKNFILISNQFAIQQQDEADNVIIFGKVDQSTFSVQYRHPLSLYQAFGIIMSEFDFKLNCE